MPTEEQIMLSEEQQTFYNLMENYNDNIFITGEAGTGKSYLIEYFRDHTEKNYVLLAPTGTAAINIDGQTVHSFFSLPVDNENDIVMTFEMVLSRWENIPSIHKTKKNIRSVETIIIDEVSMVRADMLDTINKLCQYVRGNLEPFGGIQFILVGDLYQLPPIIKNPCKDELLSKYPTVHFFSAPDVCKNMKVLKLTQIFRQSDTQFITLLNDLRVGRNIGNIISTLNTRVCKPPKGKHPLVLSTTRQAVSDINLAELSKLTTPRHTYFRSIEGDINEDKVNIPERVTLREGMRVMSIANVRNAEGDLLYSNGQLGTILDIEGDDETQPRITVDFDDIGTYKVSFFNWDILRYEADDKGKMKEIKVGNISQVPLVPAYAITAHKSQGQTYNSIELRDFRAFCPGQLYTAISRCRSLDGIFLDKPITASSVIVDQTVKQVLGDK